MAKYLPVARVLLFWLMSLKRWVCTTHRRVAQPKSTGANRFSGILLHFSSPSTHSQIYHIYAANIYNFTLLLRWKLFGDCYLDIFSVTAFSREPSLIANHPIETILRIPLARNRDFCVVFYELNCFWGAGTAGAHLLRLLAHGPGALGCLL